eukprot:scaffold11990_cov107-Isochrysis_galbana.AAC.3
MRTVAIKNGAISLKQQACHVRPAAVMEAMAAANAGPLPGVSSAVLVVMRRAMSQLTPHPADIPQAQHRNAQKKNRKALGASLPRQPSLGAGLPRHANLPFMPRALPHHHTANNLLSNAPRTCYSFSFSSSMTR